MELIRLHILVNCMELRWRQPCSDPVAPCMKKKIMNHNKTTQVPERSFTSIQMVHTHTHIFDHLCLKSLSHALVMMPFAGISEHQKTRNWNTAQQDKRIQKVSKSLGLFLGCLACLIARNSCQEPGSLDAWEAASFESEISSLEVQRISKVEDT